MPPSGSIVGGGHRSEFPSEIDVRVRQGDLGRDGSASTIGVARWLEDARIRLHLRRFARLVAAGGIGPFQILLVSQRVERLAPVGRVGACVQVHTGIRRIGRSSMTYEHAVIAGGTHVGSGEATIVLADVSGSLALPDELIEDLVELQLPGPNQPTAPRPGAERLHRDHYPAAVPLRARIGDVDINQHVNFMALATWYDEAVAAFASAAVNVGGTGPVPDLPPWSYRIQYLGEVTYPGDYGIGVAVRSFDVQSVQYELGIFRDGTCLGLADALGPRDQLTDETLAGARAPGQDNPVHE